MNFFVKEYKSQPILAKIAKGDKELQTVLPQSETIIINSNRIIFGKDGYSLPVESIKHIEQLHDGDIVSIDELGRGYKLFSLEENDATVFITGHCNSNCIMCPCSDYERQFNNGLDDVSMFKYLDLLPDTLGHIVVTGGEPTLRLDLFTKVMKYINSRFPRVETLILTNGRSMAFAKLVDFLKLYSPKNLRVAIPVHGHEDNLHDNITQDSGSYHQTDIGIKNLLSHGIRVELRVVISKLNYSYLDDIAESIVKKYSAAELVNFVGLETRGNCAVNFDKVYIDHVTAFNHLKSAAKILIDNGINVGIYNFPLCNVEQGYWELCKKSITPEKIRYVDECNECIVKNICGGFFNTTMVKTKPHVNPVKFTER